MVIRIWACKHSSRLSPSVTSAPSNPSESASRNTLAELMLVRSKESALRPIRAVDAKDGWLVMEHFEDAFGSV